MSDRILFPKEDVIDTKYFNIHQDREVPIPGFFIMEAKRKLRSVSEFTNEEAVEFMDLLRKVRKGMFEVLGIKDVYLFQDEDTSHNFHLWIFPRHSWMEEFGRKIQSVRPIMNYAKENMITDVLIKEVKEHVKKIRKYME